MYLLVLSSDGGHTDMSRKGRGWLLLYETISFAEQKWRDCMKAFEVKKNYNSVGPLWNYCYYEVTNKLNLILLTV